LRGWGGGRKKKRNRSGREGERGERENGEKGKRGKGKGEGWTQMSVLRKRDRHVSG
tara:strand:- start:165 stop:332 length:168 start_codon:yes stop_codon:yes gene_type:complete